MIELRNVSKNYKKQEALSDFSYKFSQTGAYGILGVNGAGKSTLIGCITNNLAYRGELEYRGLSRQEIGYVPQELAIYPDLSVLDNLLFFGAIYRLKKDQARQNAEDLIQAVGLTEKRQELAKNLSGGMKRKLNLITGLIHQPKFLICDEVCVGIDPLSRQDILTHIKKLQSRGLGLIYTSHYLDEIEFLCERILFLDRGRLVLEGTSGQVGRQICGDAESNLAEVFEKLLRPENSGEGLDHV